jgi:hypothetical protein
MATHWINADRVTAEIAQIGTDFPDERRVSTPLALVLHDSGETVIEGTKEELTAALLEWLLLVKGWEPGAHLWGADAEAIACKVCGVRIEPESIKRAPGFPCESDNSRYAQPHIWRHIPNTGFRASYWECILCETNDHTEPCSTD